MYDLTGFQRDLLYIIAGLNKPHGLAIKEELEEYYEKGIHHGRLYPNLDTLVKKGLVKKSEKDRRTNEYSVMRRGRQEIEAREKWKRQYISDDRMQSWSVLYPHLHRDVHAWPNMFMIQQNMCWMGIRTAGTILNFYVIGKSSLLCRVLPYKGPPKILSLLVLGAF